MSCNVRRRPLDVAAAAARDGSVVGRRQQSETVAGRDADATGVRAEPPADKSGHVALVHRQHIARHEAQFFLGVGAVGVQRLRLHRRRRHRLV